MSLALDVKTNEGSLRASIHPLEESDLGAVLSVWKMQCNIYSGRYPERAAIAAYHWDWIEVIRGVTGQVHGLQVPGLGGYVGLLAIDLDGRTGENLPCLTVVYVAKMPQAFEISPVGRVGVCLVVEAVRLSIEYGMQGRVRIPEALRATPFKPEENPSALYQSLLFKRTENSLDSVEYDDLEISSENAEILMERFTNGE